MEDANGHYVTNDLPTPGHLEAQINAANFYRTFAVGKGKPMFLAETGGTFHTKAPTGPGELAIKQAWWKSGMFNNTFLDSYPQIKMFTQAELRKFEDGGIPGDERDWKVMENPTVTAAFVAEYNNFKDRYVPANNIDANSPTGSSGGTTGSAGGTTTTGKSAGSEFSQSIPALLLGILAFFL